MKKKKCGKCGKNKPLTLENFGPRDTTDGFHRYCRVCLRKIGTDRYKKKKDFLLEQSKEYYQIHKEEVKEYNKNHRTENRARSKAWYEENRVEILAKRKGLTNKGAKAENKRA
jgi:hypothetical protein